MEKKKRYERERRREAPMVATALIRGRGVSGEAEWRRWLHRGTEQRRERAVAEKEEVQGVKEAKFLEGEGKKSLGGMEAVVI